MQFLKLVVKNKFWSELYAILYSDLVKSIPIMYDICNKNFDHFGKMFNNIEYISPDEDYNKYCIINKQNEERKGMSNFLTYLMRNNLIDTKNMCNLIIKLLDTIIQEMTKENKNKHIEEIAENLALLILNGNTKLESSDKWDIIYEKVELLATKKAKNFNGLSQKTVFKMMDIYDEL